MNMIVCRSITFLSYSITDGIHSFKQLFSNSILPLILKFIDSTNSILEGNTLYMIVLILPLLKAKGQYNIEQKINTTLYMQNWRFFFILTKTILGNGKETRKNVLKCYGQYRSLCSCYYTFLQEHIKTRVCNFNYIYNP